MELKITLTGVDERTDLDALSKILPFSNIHIEFGILYTWNTEKRNRYPCRSSIVRILEQLQGNKLSLHVCGRKAKEKLINYDLTDMTHLVQRIQVNGHIWYDDALKICELYSNHTIITQYNNQSIGLLELDAPNHALLIDSSGGRGISPEHWDRPNTIKSVGFAGGLGPDNIQDELLRIKKVAIGDWWVDMEGKLRDENDWFDINKVNQIISLINLI